MDPNFWALDHERTFQALLTIVVLAFLIERALAPLFESKLFIRAVRRRSVVKEPVAVAVAVLVCWVWQFDAVSIILRDEVMNWYGFALTGLVIAGGSKASVKLFKDVLGIMSSAEADKDGHRLTWLHEDAVLARGKLTVANAAAGTATLAALNAHSTALQRLRSEAEAIAARYPEDAGKQRVAAEIAAWSEQAQKTVTHTSLDEGGVTGGPAA